MYKRSAQWIVNELKKASVTPTKHTPCAVVLVIDATYWKRGDGIIFAKAANLNKILLISCIKHETIADYLDIFHKVENLGYQVVAVVTDGKKGVREAFNFLPYQSCQFHQIATITRLLTKKPKLEASIELKAIVSNLTVCTQPSFEPMLKLWHTKWESFINEKTYHPNNKNFTRTHKNLWSAHRSLLRNLPTLFTYQKFPQLFIPNTTNSLDGFFSHLKDKIRIHRGIQKTMKLKIVNEIISN